MTTTDPPPISLADLAIPETMTAPDYPGLALAVAKRAHAGVPDRSGAPYIQHPRRVARRLQHAGDRAVAYLHDVLEDTAVTAGELHMLDPFSATWSAIVDDVVLLTHLPHEPRAEYHARIRTSRRAVRVKLADVADNMDPTRLALLPEADIVRLVRKYARTVEALGGLPLGPEREEV